jgi:hypothetical protein
MIKEIRQALFVVTVRSVDFPEPFAQINRCAAKFATKVQSDSLGRSCFA